MHIVFEGLPGSGKSTITERMAREHGYICIDEMLVPIPDQADELVYVLHDIAKHAKRAGYSHTVMDRSYLSTLAYNYANDRISNAHNFKRIRERINIAIADGSLPKADILFYLDVPVETSLARQKHDNSSFWFSAEMLRRIRDFNLMYLKNEYGGKVVWIDGTMPDDEVYALVCRELGLQ